MKFLAAKTVLAAAIALGAIQGAHAGIPVIDGGNLTQNILTAIESVAQTLKQAEEYAKQVEQYQTQLQQYENQLQNTAAPAAYIWDQANATINKLIQAQDMLTYYQNRAGSLDAYLAKYQDAAYYRSSPCFNGGGCTPEAREAMAENRRMSNQAQKEANAAMFKGLAQQQENMQADARQLERLQSAATTADGQVKAIQYANQLASHQSNQLLQIRGLMVAQQNALVAQQQEDQNRKAIELAAGEYSRTGTDVQKSPVVEW
ncbi:conjugal transfer protein TrbJ [Xanthomonas euvesicatoria]|uniref:P-type conjugative transfer protein TrbJ n=1 Tax=Gammaproteobacteria TaxID=1236 RepID=UPI00062D4E19|nr:P-type conjugative transfer protein TrbJ [Xanthomonas euvesicatoria]EJU9618004.1 P-type conjugative transfer protein TrbJ [Pseudomonas aeruginosa]KLB54901.1 conjugal transfer protein TrbJ [Xanthomonas euvesicatoria]KLB72413.1 conjugal transfer protein TrbJ [Xanthomonas euvesicatoria]KLB84219.1 conjugal transfer protein TrbJ [Xanthomonas euvesicatoria]KLB85006.1 conjugal transfer protein TrbJ [Xanthomonas euvesicatoria]